MLFVFGSTYSQDTVTIRNESLQSLELELYFNHSGIDTYLGSGSGFVIKSKTRYYLVTNYHVITGGKTIDGFWEIGSSKILPNKIKIHYLSNTTPGDSIIKYESLYDKKFKQLWIQDSVLVDGKNKLIDVVELPLNDTSRASINPINYHIDVNKYVILQPTDILFIIGYPFSLNLHLTSHGLPIWESGIISSEPNLPDDLNIWVNATTFPGMSGSPAYFISNGTYWDSKKRGYLTASIFVGVFSAVQQVNTNGNNTQKEYDIYSIIWKATYLRGIFDKLN